MENKKISVIQVPFGLGAGRPGTELGPESIRATGLIRQVRQLGLELTGEHTIEVQASSPAIDTASKVKHLPLVKEMASRVADAVTEAVQGGSFPLVIGGDRSVSIGALAGLTKQYTNPGVIFFTAFGGLHTEETTPSGYAHGMPLAVALGKAGFPLSDIAEGSGLLKKEHIVLIGLRHLDPEEKKLILSEGIRYFSMYEIDRMGIHQVVKEALKITGNGTDGVHVSISAECLDPLEAPGVGSGIPGGLSYREAHFACELLAESGLVKSMDVTEVNASQDENRRTARLAVGLIASVLGKRII
jgi:arginase